MKVNLIILSLLPTFFLSVNAQTVLYQEYFTSQIGKGVQGPVPYVYDTSTISWSIDPASSNLTANTDYLKVNSSSQMEARDLGGELIWYSDTIDISSVAAVNLSVDITETGGMDNPDYMNLYYVVDNGALQLFENNGLNSGVFDTLTATSDSVSGTTLQIVIKIRNNSDAERHFVDNVLVTENIANIQNLYDLPDQSSIQLKWLDPVSSFDEILIVASLNSHILDGTPSGNGLLYTANQTLGSGTSLLGGSVIFSGLGNATTYYGTSVTDSCFIKVFTRKDSTWSKGKELSVYYNPPTLGDLRITEYARHASIPEYSYLEIYNTTNSDINLAGGKIIAKNVSSISKVIDLRTEISVPVIVPANGFLILNRDRSLTLFENEWDVDLANTGYPVNYIRTDENNFGNKKFFEFRQGGTEDTNDGDLIDASTLRPETGERVFQLPYDYWNISGSVADSATPGSFLSFENPEQIDLVYLSGNWIPSAPSSSTGTKTAAILTKGSPFVNNAVLQGLYIWNTGSTNITSQNVTVNSFLTVENNGSISITGSGSLTCIGLTEIKRNGLNVNTDYNIWGTPFNTLLDLQTVFPSANPCDMYVFEASSQQYKYDFIVGSSITCLGNNTYTITNGNVILAPENVPDGKFDVGRGYFIPGNIENEIIFSSSSSTLNNGAISTNIYGSSGSVVSGSNDWNLISNPYPSGISANIFISSNLGLITNAVYVYDQGLMNSSFSTYNATDNFNIASCQGFFVDANSTTDGYLGTVNFTNAMRNNNNSDFRSGNSLHAIYIKVTTEFHQEDVMRIYFDESAQNGFDFVYDANKMMNPYFNLASKVNNKRLIFNGLPKLSSSPRNIPLFFNSTRQRIFTISTDSLLGDFTGKDIILEDRFLSEFQNLKEGNYTFQTDSATWENRFYLHIQNASNSTGIENIPISDVTIISLSDEIIVTSNDPSRIISVVQLLDVKGQLIKTVNGYSHTITIPITGTSSGIYLVKYTNGFGNVGTGKVAIH